MRRGRARPAPAVPPPPRRPPGPPRPPPGAMTPTVARCAAARVVLTPAAPRCPTFGGAPVHAPRPARRMALRPRALSQQDELKQQAAWKAVEYVQSGMVLGLGTGSTAAFAVDRIGQLLKSGDLKDIVAVPTSIRTYEQAKSAPAAKCVLSIVTGARYLRRRRTSLVVKSYLGHLQVMRVARYWHACILP